MFILYESKIDPTGFTSVQPTVQRTRTRPDLPTAKHQGSLGDTLTVAQHEVCRVVVGAADLAPYLRQVHI